MTDDEAVKVVADVLTGADIDDESGDPDSERARLAVAALRKAGWGPLFDTDEDGEPLCGAVTVYNDKPVRCHLPHTHVGGHRTDSPSGQRFRWAPDDARELDEARSLLRDLEEAARACCEPVEEEVEWDKRNKALDVALAAVAQARKEGGW